MKTAIIGIFTGLFIGWAVASTVKDGTAYEIASANNVAVVSGKQIIEIRAKGGYSPRLTRAKADMPTVLKIDTNGTFDCSAALRIPSLGYSANLPPSGVSEIKVPPQKAGTKLQGLCAMGMYGFAVNFQ